MGDVEELSEAFKKDYGEHTVKAGNELVVLPRLRTGIFPFDAATGGGLPKGAVTIVYGPESSAKTILCLKALASHQRLHPEKKCVFVDVERAWDPKWSAHMGVDTENVIVIRPTYAEQVVDMVEAIVHAEDAGLVVVDSLAAMATAQELSNSAEKAVVGGGALAIGKLMRRVNSALSSMEGSGDLPTLLFVNQLRYKIGLLFGNPEHMPGGMAPKHWSCLTVRMYGKNVTDKKINAFRPIQKHCQAVLQKWKVPISEVSSEWDVVLYPYAGHKQGDIDDWSAVQGYLERYGLYAKEGSKYRIDGDLYPTIKSFRERLAGEQDYDDDLKTRLIELLAKEAQGE